MSADAFHEQDSTPRPCRIMGGTDMLILHTTTTSTPIGVHRGAMHGNPQHSPEDRSSDGTSPRDPRPSSPSRGMCMYVSHVHTCVSQYVVSHEPGKALTKPSRALTSLTSPREPSRALSIRYGKKTDWRPLHLLYLRGLEAWQQNRLPGQTKLDGKPSTSLVLA